MVSIDSEGPKGKFSAMPGAVTIHSFADFLALKWDNDFADISALQTVLNDAWEYVPAACAVKIFDDPVTRTNIYELKWAGTLPAAYVTLRRTSFGIVPETWAWELKQLYTPTLNVA